MQPGDRELVGSAEREVKGPPDFSAPQVVVEMANSGIQALVEPEETEVRPEIQVLTDRVGSSPSYCVPAEMRMETGGRQKRGTVTTGIRR